MLNQLDSSTGGYNAASTTTHIKNRDTREEAVCLISYGDLREPWLLLPGSVELPSTKVPTSRLSLPMYFNKNLHFNQERDLHQLKSASPFDPACIPTSAKWMFDNLISRPNCLVCTGVSFKSMRTCYPDEIGDDTHAYNFVVPGYMRSRTGMTLGDPAQGKLPRVSQRCNDNTGTTEYVVFRNPHLKPAGQAILILGLSKIAGLVMAIETGRGGIEAWFSVAGWNETEIKKFRKVAVQHGSSGSTLSPSFPYAFPGGFCDRSGVMNRLIYFDPSAIGTIPNKKI